MLDNKNRNVNAHCLINLQTAVTKHYPWKISILKPVLLFCTQNVKQNSCQLSNDSTLSKCSPFDYSALRYSVPHHSWCADSQGGILLKWTPGLNLIALLNTEKFQMWGPLLGTQP